jgi:hypothetical protein
MSRRTVEQAIGKLVTDETFREWFFRDAAVASRSVGLELSPRELEALGRIPTAEIARFSSCVDDRIRRMPLGAEPGSGAAPDRAR